MSAIYGFNLCCKRLSEEELAKFRTVMQNHPIGWSSSGEGGGGAYVFNYVESKCPEQFDDAVTALKDAVQCVWRELGRYVEVSADVCFIKYTRRVSEETYPRWPVSTKEDDYREWLAEQ